jgi:hypothetical protein
VRSGAAASQSGLNAWADWDEERGLRWLVTLSIRRQKWVAVLYPADEYDPDVFALGSCYPSGQWCTRVGVSTARDWSDFYEEDEPREVIERITSRGRTLVASLRGDAGKVRSDEILKEIVERTVRDYRGWSGRQLAELTHSQQPWLQAREGLAPGQRSRNKISLVSMREWFRLQESLPDTEYDEPL